MVWVRLRQARQLARASGRGKATAVLAAIGVALIAGGGAAAKSLYHPPATAPERALDALVAKVWANGLVEHLRGPAPPGGRIDYSGLITARLAARVLADEPAKVKACKPNVECQWRYYPVTCPNDGDGSLYRTETVTADKVVISFRWRDPMGYDDAAKVGAYEMVRTGGVWKLDAYRCDLGPTERMW
jgi:hypothetical protein